MRQDHIKCQLGVSCPSDHEGIFIKSFIPRYCPPVYEAPGSMPGGTCPISYKEGRDIMSSHMIDSIEHCVVGAHRLYPIWQELHNIFYDLGHKLDTNVYTLLYKSEEVQHGCALWAAVTTIYPKSSCNIKTYPRKLFFACNMQSNQSGVPVWNIDQ